MSRGGAVSRWKFRDDKQRAEKRKWLTELGFYPRRQPVRNRTEELGGIQTGGEGESLPGTEIEEWKQG